MIKVWPRITGMHRHMMREVDAGAAFFGSFEKNHSENEERLGFLSQPSIILIAIKIAHHLFC